ncbi:MAG TPA: XRE family transcriptional regulator [Pseudolabrys sp.]|jgi:transcriptional regulator with XRE-family HTH domain
MKDRREKNGRAARGAGKPNSTGQGIGARVRFMREQRKMTLEQLSSASNLTKSFVSKVERGISVPSISTAMRLAESFDLTISQLVGEDHYEDGISVVRKGERRSFMRPGAALNYNYETLAAPKRFKRMEPYIMRPPFKFQGKRFFEHVGEEFMFVLSGTIEVEFSNQTYQLHSGDSLYFDSHLPHRSRSLGTKHASVLVVVLSMGPRDSSL